jgi:uncharacterized protein YqiB (DUF1249 family)
MIKIQQKIFAQLLALGIVDENGVVQHQYMKFVSPGLMDLNVDRLDNTIIAIAHNTVQNGDVMADPDMQVVIFPQIRCAEALSFQNDFLGIYQQVYDGENVDSKLRKELNIFLNDWLNTVIELQGYTLAETEDG